MQHKDVLEQFVNYEVPADKMDELVRFDGSIIVFRTDGLMSVRCDNEAANIFGAEPGPRHCAREQVGRGGAA